MAHSTLTRKDLDALDADSPTFGADYNRIYHAICDEIGAAHARLCKALSLRNRIAMRAHGCTASSLQDEATAATAAWQSVKARYGDSLVECALAAGGEYC